eukprot:2066993-Rhodomonas_salina.1
MHSPHPHLHTSLLAPSYTTQHRSPPIEHMAGFRCVSQYRGSPVDHIPEQRQYSGVDYLAA